MSDRDRLIISLDDFRLSRAGPPPPGSPPPCPHNALTYSPAEKLVTCDDCKREVGGFDAFMILTKYFERLTAEAHNRLSAAKAAEQATVIRRAAKVFDKAWSGHEMAVCCPHCRVGLLPEDILHGALGQCSASFERARRARAAAEKEST